VRERVGRVRVGEVREEADAEGGDVFGGEARGEEAVEALRCGGAGWTCRRRRRARGIGVVAYILSGWRSRVYGI